MRALGWASIAGVAGLALGASIGVAAEQGEEAGDVPVAVKDIPAAVRTVADRYAGGKKLERAVIADEDGLSVYELHYAGGLEVQTTKSGDFFAREEKVPESAVPALVKERAAKLLSPGAKVSFERTLSVFYEAAARDAKGREREVLVNPAGAAFQEIAGGVREQR